MIGIKLNRIFGKKGENIKDEKGAVPIVEATFIFPIVFFCMFFLIYIGMYILQSVLIYTQTQKVASIVSKSMAVTGYEKVGKHTADNVNFDFKDNKYFTQDSVNTIYDEKAKLYRYFYPDPIAGNSDIESINSSLTSLIDNLSIISGGGVTCDINAKNYFINQTVSVTIKREGAIPEIFSYIGMDGVSSDHFINFLHFFSPPYYINELPIAGTTTIIIIAMNIIIDGNISLVPTLAAFTFTLLRFSSQLTVVNSLRTLVSSLPPFSIF